MWFKGAIAAALTALAPVAVHAQESAITIGKSAYGALCAVCHGEDAKGGGEVAELFEVKPPDLTKLAEREGGRYPFSRVYEILVVGMQAPGHGSEMPIWGDYFMADALEDRGVSRSDAVAIAAGRALSLTHYLETLQE
jgi:mono/diheme cytochrome c family protein